MLKKIISTCFWCLVLWGALLPEKGFATSYPYNFTNINNIASFMSDFGITAEIAASPISSGIWEVTPLGAEAGYTNLFMDGSNILFNNKQLQNQFGEYKAADLATSRFVETHAPVGTDKSFDLMSQNVKIYSLTKDWVLDNTLLLKTGSLLLAFNDLGGDSDFDDFILAARPASATPIPGAIWLLGSGLLGMVGLRRVART